MHTISAPYRRELSDLQKFSFIYWFDSSLAGSGVGSSLAGSGVDSSLAGSGVDSSLAGSGVLNDIHSQFT